MEQIELLLREQTSRTLLDVKSRYRKIISLLMFGLLFNAAISPFLHFLLGDEGPVFRLTTGGLLSLVMILTVGLVAILFYWMRYSSLETEVTDEDILSAISHKISLLKRARNREITFIALIFFCLMVISRLMSQYLGHGDFTDIFRKDILLALLIGIAIMIFYITRRLKAYKKDISELAKLLEKEEA